MQGENKAINVTTGVWVMLQRGKISAGRRDLSDTQGHKEPCRSRTVTAVWDKQWIGRAREQVPSPLYKPYDLSKSLCQSPFHCLLIERNIYSACLMGLSWKSHNQIMNVKLLYSIKALCKGMMKALVTEVFLSGRFTKLGNRMENSNRGQYFKCTLFW